VNALFPLMGAVLGVVVGFGATWFLRRRWMTAERSAAERIMTEAEAAAREIVIAAKDQAIEQRSEAEREVKRRRKELEEAEERLNQRREKLDRRVDQTENRARNLDERERKIEGRETRLTNLEAERQAELERVAGLTRQEAKDELIAVIAEDARADAARIVREIESSAREAGEERARDIIVTCMQRCATDVVSDTVSSTVILPSEEMKGRIIGRQGRNIRAFEQATGVDVIVDDTPEAVTLSCFDPVRREVARLSLLALIGDGRIHPPRIEHIVRKTREELDREIKKAGEDAAFEAGVHGLNPELLKLLGRLKYRTSYGQNVLSHAVETAHLAAMLAAETGADVNVARAGGLLHDLGKAVSHEVDGPHAAIGAEMAQRHGVPVRVVNAIAAHHHEVDQENLEAVLVEIADAISGSRPGARRESLELYIKRLEMLENIARTFAGVQESYAIQAGREIRIIVRPENIDDLGATQLSRDVARKVEESLEYPGQIKVTVIREMRAVDYAK
jgi:ribonucrease Y